MNLKDLIFGGGVKSGDDGGTYRDSIQAWLPIKNIIGGVVITKDGRFVKILELLPVNIYLKSPNDRQNIISSFAAYLKIAPNDLQMVARTLPADTQAYVEQMQRYAEKEDNEACREMIEDNIQEIGNGIASDAMRHRFFLVFQYEAGMRAKRNTVDSIIQRLNEEADTARRYLDVCELEVLEPQYSDNFVLKLLYEILSKKTSQRVRLPDGVFDTPMFFYPFSNVYDDERVCTGNNILPRYKKLSAMKNFPRYLLGLPDNDDMFYSAHNQKGLDHKALLEHLKDKDPAYYYTDILVPNGRTLSDFILRR